MSEKAMTFDTVEQLIAQAEKTYEDSTYTLEARSDWEWEDPKAGQAWDDDRSAMLDTWTARARAQSTPEKTLHRDDFPGFVAAEAELDARKPKRNYVVRYHLYETGSRYHGQIIHLGQDLGAKIASTWKHHRDFEYRFLGHLSLRGIVKRLGADDGLAARIETARKAEKLAGERRARNYARQQLREALTKMGDAIEKAQQVGVLTGVDVPNTLMGRFEDLVGADEK